MFTNKTVIITGASSGLGKSLALDFAKKGARLALFARHEERLRETEKVCRDLSGESMSVIGDVTKPEDCERLMIQTSERFGSIDYLVLNAGVSMWAKFEDVEDISLFQKIMETNYLGAVYCTYHALSYLKKSRGMVVAISSIQGKIAVPYHSGYVASKHAVQGFFDTLRSEIEGQGVDVLTVLPYWLKGTTLRDSAFGKDGMALGQESKKSKKAIPIDKCSLQILDAMQKRKRELIIPWTLRVLPWLNLLHPGFVEYLVNRKIKQNKSDQKLRN